MGNAAVELVDVAKSYGSHAVLRGIDLSIDPGEFLVFVGPSGCGKSTLLRMIAGLEEISGGDLKIDGVRMNEVHPSKRGIAMVFQSYALYPHMTAAENIGFSMRLAGEPKQNILRKVTETAGILQLGELLPRRPAEISGGQRQRVAIGRSIVRNPRVFLFDEPLSNLDAALRVHMRLELERLHKDLEATMIYVTHDQVEAMTLADKIVVLNGTKIQQQGSPIELYTRPDNQFVATFIGSPSMNLLGAKLEGDRVEALGQSLPKLPLMGGEGVVTLGIRPEHLSIGEAGDFTFDAQLSQIERLGAETLLYCSTEGGEMLTVRAPGIHSAAPGEKIPLSARSNDIFVFEGPVGNSEGRALVDYDSRPDRAANGIRIVD